MNDRTVLLDFDDTLIRTQKRHFFVLSRYYQIRYEQEFPLSLNHYVKERLQKKNTDFLLIQAESEFEQFKNYWISEIESMESLMYDELIVKLELLELYKKKFKSRFEIVSFRSNSSNAEKQLAMFGLSNVIDDAYFIPHVHNTKADTIREISNLRRVNYFIGDEVRDKSFAEECGIEFVQVRTCWLGEAFYATNSFEDINEFLFRQITK